MNSFLFNPKYYYITCGYAAMRKIIELKNAKVVYDRDPVPMLMADKVAVLGFSSLVGPYWWPYYIYKDMTKLEMNFRKESFSHSPMYQNKYVFDYIFS